MDYKLYYLVDPESRELRYVGVTKNGLGRRLQGHISNCSRGKDHKSNWIKSLSRKGLKPEINLLQSFSTESDVLDAERYWIKYFRNAGCNLTNSCEGGKGTLGLSPESREKIRLANTGRSAWNKGKKTGLPSWNRGQDASLETRQKQSESHKGKSPWNKGKSGVKASLETRNKMSAAKKGNANLHSCKVILCTTTNTIFKSLTEAATAMKLHIGGISKVLRGTSESTRGYHFQYHLAG